LNPVAEAVAEVEVLVVLVVFTLEELEVLEVLVVEVVEVVDFFVLVFKVVLDVEEVDFVVDATVLVEVVVAVPGIHWEYHSL
jgi:hypothetical protein